MPPYILSTAHTIFLRTKRCSIDTNRSTSYYCTCREHTVLRTASSCSFEYRVSLGAEELDEPCFNHVLNRRVPLLGEQHSAPLGGFRHSFREGGGERERKTQICIHPILPPRSDTLLDGTTDAILIIQDAVLVAMLCSPCHCVRFDGVRHLRSRTM